MINLPKEVRGVTDDLDRLIPLGCSKVIRCFAGLLPCPFGRMLKKTAAHFAATGRAYSFDFSLNIQIDPRIVYCDLLPFIFYAFSMDAVGRQLVTVVREFAASSRKPVFWCETPDYCTARTLRAALREMIVPSWLPVASSL